MPESIAILAPVFLRYRWIAPFLRNQLAAFWANHPPLHFCGLTAEEAVGLPLLPLRSTALPRDWVRFVRDAAADLADCGVERIYLILEEQLPLAACHATQLNTTLPRLLDELGASYISLLGWDHRRSSSRGPVLGARHFQLRRLATTGRNPRFHLHPALWRTDCLLACLDLALSRDCHSPHRFERIVANPNVDELSEYREGCYLICGQAMAAQPASRWGAATAAVERAVFRKLRAIQQLLPGAALRETFWRAIRADDFFFNGPYPMIYSGVMSRGGINPFFVRSMRRKPERCAVLEELLLAQKNLENGNTAALGSVI